MEFKSRCVLKAAEGPPFFYRRKPAVNNSHFEYNQRIRSPDFISEFRYESFYNCNSDGISVNMGRTLCNSFLGTERHKAATSPEKEQGLIYLVKE